MPGSSHQPVLRLQLSALQHLTELLLDYIFLEAVAANGSVLKVVNLLPRLQLCTKLVLYTWGDPQLTGAVAAFQAMPALQDLDFDGGDVYTSKSLPVLPTSLTRLRFFGQEIINTTTAATISKLTGLRVLEAEAIRFDTSVLANCSCLERVEIDIRRGDCSLSGAGGYAAPLLVFGKMPSLQHLRLQSEFKDPVATAAEVASVSAWSNLTYLSLGDSEYCALPPAAYDSWFPAGRQCPHLQHVDMGVWVLGNTAAVQRMARACPGLKELELLSCTEDNIQIESACVAASLQALTNLTSLTRLHVHGPHLPEGCCISPTVVNAWSHWTNLQDLDLIFKYRKLEDVLVLTQLRSLRALSIDGSVGCQYDRLEVQAKASGPPDVWCQLPAAVWGEAIRQKEEQVQQRLREQQREQTRVAILLEKQKAAQAEAALLSQQHAAAVGRVVALQHDHAATQAKVAALQEQQAADQAEAAALLQKQRQAGQAEATLLHERLQEQQAQLAAARQQADADRAQTALLQGQVATLQATVTALLERQG